MYVNGRLKQIFEFLLDKRNKKETDNAQKEQFRLYIHCTVR